ncbi:twin-arginine translocation signal domain-containing protein [Escherichia coli]|nr:twin-arginine translocation signal domain-containing protein [Escherichia coli]
MKIHTTEALMKAEISRRSLMKTSALGSLALASSAFTLPFSQMVRAAEAPVEEKAVWSSCTVSLGLWFPDGEEITLLLGLTGMATLLAATTHAPIMSTLMICEMTGEYQLLPGLLIACVIASVISRTLHRDSIYRQHTAQHS